MDLSVLIYVVIAVLISAICAGIITFIVTYFLFKSKVPGYSVITDKKCTPILRVSGDNYAEYFKGLKHVYGSILFNPNKPEETIDTTRIDNKPSLNIGGIRTFLSVDLSPINIDPKDAAHTQLVINYFDEHKDEYPKLAKLQDYEWGGAITHDPKTAREVLLKYCIVEHEYVDDKGIKHQRTQEEINKLQQKNVQEYVNEINKLLAELHKDVYIDMARVVNFTQCKIRSAALRTLWAEMEKLVRYDMEKKYAGMHGNIGFYWLPICLLGGFIVATICFKVLGL